jgi:uncharacterized protein with HEPN domain
MRPEELYLRDIVEAADAIQRFITSINEDHFMQDELRQSGILQKLTVIGEAAARLPGEFRKAHPVIEWEDIIGFRNIAVHEYFSIMWEIVWTTAIEDVPKLREQITQILTDEFNQKE